MLNWCITFYYKVMLSAKDKKKENFNFQMTIIIIVKNN